jgi:hypothetical protein
MNEVTVLQQAGYKDFRDEVSLESDRCCWKDGDMQILIVGAGDRRCCGYFGRVASPRNNCEFVLREIHRASAEAVWTFLGRRCYACGPIVRTLGEHSISNKRNSARHNEIPWSPIR